MSRLQRLIEFVRSNETVVRECRRCGTAVDVGVDQCPRCGHRGIATYRIK